MAPSDDDDSSKRAFKCCKNKTTNNVQCINCGEIFHSSCAKVKNIEIFNGKFLKCCENKETSDQLKLNLQSGENSREEITLLKRIIKEMEIKYQVLEENNNLLKENIRLLRENAEMKVKSNVLTASPNVTVKVNKAVATASSTVPADGSQATTYSPIREISAPGSYATSVARRCQLSVSQKNVNKNKNILPPTKLQGGSLKSAPKTPINSPCFIQNSDAQSAINEAISESKMNQIINLVHDENNANQLHGNEGWQIQASKRRRNRRFMVGGNSEINDIKSIPKNVALHVSRLHPNTTPNDLEKILKNHFPEVRCESHNSKKPEVYASMKVIINQENFKKAWQRNVWPNGVLVSKFFQPKRVPYNNIVDPPNQ